MAGARNLCILAAVAAMMQFMPCGAFRRAISPSACPAFVVRSNGDRLNSIRPRSLGQHHFSRPVALNERPVARRIWAETGEGDKAVSSESGGLPWFLDPNTRGGLLVVSTLGTVGVLGIYQGAIAAGLDGLKAGVYMSVAVTVGIIFWTFSYVFRVANKDMTYVKQLKEYEDAVLRKRLEELQEDEVEALLEEVEKEAEQKAL